jgi:hypothetical protein
MLGRLFTAQDDSPACGNAAVVLSHGFWQREFGGDQGVLGKTLNLDGHAFPVIGVTPAPFFGVEVGRAFDVAVPLCADQLLAEDKKGRRRLPSAWWLAIMGRLKPGWTVERATADLQTLAPGIMKPLCRRPIFPTLPSATWQTSWLRPKAALAFPDCAPIRKTPLAPDGNHRAGAADCVCQPCQFAAGPSQLREREIAVRLAMGAAGAIGAPALGGKSTAGLARRGAWRQAGPGAQPRYHSFL